MGKGEYIIQLPTRQVFFQKGGGGTYIQPSGRSAVNDCKLCVRGSSRRRYKVCCFAVQAHLLIGGEGNQARKMRFLPGDRGIKTQICPVRRETSRL